MHEGDFGKGGLMNAHPIGYDERTMAILRGLLMARDDWRECLEAAAYALVGCGLGDVQQITPAHVVSMRDVPVTIVAEPRLSCGHSRNSIRYDRDAEGWISTRCLECEVERARVSAGNGG
jgi:hypothetical protein